MRQAIETKYIGPTNFKGSRIKASCAAGSITVNYLSELDVEENHFNAAFTLIKKLGWHEKSPKNKWRGGGVKKGYVFVDISKD